VAACALSPIHGRAGSTAVKHSRRAHATACNIGVEGPEKRRTAAARWPRRFDTFQEPASAALSGVGTEVRLPADRESGAGDQRVDLDVAELAVARGQDVLQVEVQTERAVAESEVEAELRVPGLVVVDVELLATAGPNSFSRSMPL
jgi:hypothetical protein